MSERGVVSSVYILFVPFGCSTLPLHSALWPMAIAFGKNYPVLFGSGYVRFRVFDGSQMYLVFAFLRLWRFLINLIGFCVGSARARSSMVHGPKLQRINQGGGSRGKGSDSQSQSQRV